MRADFDSPTEDNDWDDSESEVSDFNDDDDNTLLDFLRGADTLFESHASACSDTLLCTQRRTTQKNSDLLWL